MEKSHQKIIELFKKGELHNALDSAKYVSFKEVKGDLITLSPFSNECIKHSGYPELLNIRRSKRKYTDTPITQSQLAFMLCSTQGIQALKLKTSRSVPSGGAIHPFETYIAAKAVEGIDPGIYRYVPEENIGENRVTLEVVSTLDDYEDKSDDMLLGQSWAAKAPVVLFYTYMPSRSKGRLNEVTAAYRVMLIDLGHVGQNAMLSAAALGLGCCCLIGFDQGICDSVLGIDGVNEYTVYTISVGAVPLG